MILRLKWFLKTAFRKIQRLIFSAPGLKAASRIFGYRPEKAADEWQYIPVPGTGYVKSSEIASLDDKTLRSVIHKAEKIRWDEKGWRNYEGLFRRCSGTQSFRDKRILDFGCGLGLDSLEMLRHGNRVWAADIVPDNLRAASRVAEAHNLHLEGTVQASVAPPFFTLEDEIDIFYSNGVLHHTPHMREILQRACEYLSAHGRFQLMLYSDKGWTLATGQPVPPVHEDVARHPAFARFVHFFDSVGQYADWYSREKLEHRFGDFLSVEDVDYVTKDGRFITAVLRPKSSRPR